MFLVMGKNVGLCLYMTWNNVVCIFTKHDIFVFYHLEFVDWTNGHSKISSCTMGEGGGKLVSSRANVNLVFNDVIFEHPLFML